MNEIKKAIIPIAGLGTRFLPLSKALPKELLPLTDKPAIQYIVEEVLNSGIEEIIFINRPEEKTVINYFKKSPKLEKILEQRKKNNFLKDIKKLNEITKNTDFHSVIQKNPMGDGHAILQAKKIIKQEPVAVLFPDDIIDAETPCVAQLTQIFKTCQKPVVALMKMPKEKLSRYGVVEVEKIANRVYKIKKIVEKPSPDSAPSDLVIIGRYIHTSEVFGELQKAKPGYGNEIIKGKPQKEKLDQLQHILEEYKNTPGPLTEEDLAYFFRKLKEVYK